MCPLPEVVKLLLVARQPLKVVSLLVARQPLKVVKLLLVARQHLKVVSLLVARLPLKVVSPLVVRQEIKAVSLPMDRPQRAVACLIKTIGPRAAHPKY